MATKSLFEAYKNRLAVANTVHAKMHNGESMSNNKKLVTAKVLENVNRFMNEAFDASTGTQRADMGMFKKFAMNLTTVAVPNLIAHDLVIVHPMSSMSGYVTYIEYSYSTTKGATAAGDFISSPFGLGDVDVNYTGATVVETATEAGKTKWNAHGCFDAEGKFQEGKVMKADGSIIAIADIQVGDDITYLYNNIVVPQDKLPAIKAEMKSIPLVAKARRIAVKKYAA